MPVWESDDIQQVRPHVRAGVECPYGLFDHFLLQFSPYATAEGVRGYAATGGAFSWRDVVARYWASSTFGAPSSVAAGFAAFAARVAYILAADREMSAACLCGG